MGQVIVAPALAAQAAPVTKPTSEEQLRIALRDLFDRIATPDPRHPPFANLHPRARLWFVVTLPDGIADAETTEGEEARALLKAMFGPQRGVTVLIGAPEVSLDGGFARTRLAITTREGAKRPVCGFAYVDAVLAPSDATGTQIRWTFTQITLAHDKSRKCPAP